MNTKSFILIFSLMLVALLSFDAAAANIKLKVDRSNIELNETFTLIFESDGAVDDDPDFSPLEKDFQIINQSKSSNISIINGQYSRSQRWSVSVMALREGTLTIPPIQFGNDRSPAYQITIKPVQKSSAGAGADFISELELSPSSAYPQSQIIVTQRLLSARNINAYEFSPLKTSGVEVVKEPLGEVKQYQTRRGNTPYLVLERSFALYPQKAGELNIQPSIATARIAIGRSSPYDPFAPNTRTLRRASQARTVKVNPIPGAFRGRHWLPAKEVQLLEEFPENQSFNAGEPITRTISLLVDGQTAAQLPEIQIQAVDGLKQYPDKPLLNDNKSDDGITGVQQIKVALIADHAGTYRLPEITIPWWNTETGSLQIARIPARSFKVGAATASATGSTPAPGPTPADSNTATPAHPAAPQQVAAVEPTANTDTGSLLLWKIIAFLLASGWIWTLFLLWKARRQKPTTSVQKKVGTPSLKSIYRQLKSACDKQDARGCKTALLNWAQAVFVDAQPPHSLGQLATRLNPPLADKISQLNTLLYKNQGDTWQCDELAGLCEQFERNYNQRNSSKPDNEQLETLYH